MTEKILDIQDLRLNFYTYEGVVQALDGVNLSLRKGETLGVVGETGCGKSVTGLSVLVLVPPPGRIEGGKIVICEKGKLVDMLSEEEDTLRKIRGKHVSMVFQDPRSALNPVYTAGDQITEVLLHHRRKALALKAIEQLDRQIQQEKAPSAKTQEQKEKKEEKKTPKENAGFLANYYRKRLKRYLKHPKALDIRVSGKIPILRGWKWLIKEEAKKKAVNMLRTMRIPDPERVVGMYPHELSGGMAQRVVIAIALACSPEILIADEPTTNLDVTVQLQILNLIKELKEEFDSSIIYVTHDMGVVAEMSDRVAVMYAGNVVEISAVLQTFRKPLHPYTQALLESIPRHGFPFKSIEGTVPSLIDPPKGCRFHDRCHYAMDVCTREKPRMVEAEEDHFVQCFLYQPVG